MAITALDTHQTVKDLTAAGFTDVQAEALAYALRQAQQIDLSQLAAKADLVMATSDLRRELAEMKADLIKWMIGIVFAQFAAVVAVFKLFPGGHP
jgi:hypothetical protein